MLKAKQLSPPLIIQPNASILLDSSSPLAGECREMLLRMSEAVKQAGAFHLYKVTSLSLWHAAEQGMTAEEVLSWLAAYSRSGVPVQVTTDISKRMSRFGKLWLRQDEKTDALFFSGEVETLEELARQPEAKQWLDNPSGDYTWRVAKEDRGLLKQAFIKLGYPVLDFGGWHEGDPLAISLRGEVTLRSYQSEAVERFGKQASQQQGSGIIVLPCGAGKTIVALGIMEQLKMATLVLTTNRTSIDQWRNELLSKTSITPEQIGVYSGSSKQVGDVTLATYSILASRRSKADDYMHMELFSSRDWGLIIYDEVHLLPAPVFRLTADLQATRRLGLTATLVREDGCAEDVYALIGPKLYEMYWKQAEQERYIARVHCVEIRVPVSERSTARMSMREAAENRLKIKVVQELLAKHSGVPTLIIGHYLRQLQQIAGTVNAPLITGEVGQEERRLLYNQFRNNEIQTLVVSRIANFAVDLPDAAVAIQVSGSFGSRQEEAQRIGRVLRQTRESKQAWFYSLVSRDTTEASFALRRQMFMIEQGYEYERRDYCAVQNAAFEDREGAHARFS